MDSSSKQVLRLNLLPYLSVPCLQQQRLAPMRENPNTRTCSKVDDLMEWRVTSCQTRSPRAGGFVHFCLCPRLCNLLHSSRMCVVTQPEVLIQHLSEMGRLARRGLVVISCACDTQGVVHMSDNAQVRVNR